MKFQFIPVQLKFLKTRDQHITLQANFQALAPLNLLLNVDNYNLEHYKLISTLGVLKYQATNSVTGMTRRTRPPVSVR